VTAPVGAAALIRPDGSVVIPPAIAGDVAAALVRDIAAQRRRDGGHIPSRTRVLLYALHQANCRHVEPDQTDEHDGASDPGSEPEPAGTMTVTEAADQLGCTPEYVRQLLRSGRLRGRRTRGLWLVERDSLTTYRRKAA
jgi:excisionase family DNA binding protein